MSASALSFLILIIIAIAAFFIWLIYSRRYQRASQETAFVRTGYGGMKVVMHGGALVFPTLHEVIQVNMNTLRLDVGRATNQALITKDRMRIDVQAEFYVRVKPTRDEVALAAQTLGRRTMNPDALKNLVEGQFVNSLRAVAAEMNMDELHQNRAEFVRKVQGLLAEPLAASGLELTSVSISELDQTDKKYFNPQNAFDAQGLALLTEMIQARSKQRNAIERETEVAIKKKDLEAEKQKLQLSKEEEFARLEQQREIQVHRAELQSFIVTEQVEKERLSKEAELLARQRVEQAQLASERAVEEGRISKELYLREKEIARARTLDLAEAEKDREIRATRIQLDKEVQQTQLLAERELEMERLGKDQVLKEKEIAKKKALEQAEVERDRLIKQAALAAEQMVSQARILSEKTVEEERINKDLYIRELDIARNKSLEQAEIERRKSAEL
ncbi:MAG: SPFH domain-containing protein, partial [Thermodesulfobacteriota bacterium]